MAPKILITGGAGFVGSHVADELLENGYDVRALDNLTPQAHGERSPSSRPEHLSADVELFAGDVRDPEAVARAVEGVDAVVHLAAAVGTGQSMYDIAHYTEVNALGTAILLEAVASAQVERLVVASCVNVYGEGLYRMPGGALVEGRSRPLCRLKERDWEVRDASGMRMIPAPTPETKRLAPVSVYAISKCCQERLCLAVGEAYGISTVALRLAQVYGPRQALANSQSGALAVFAAHYLNNEPPLIHEDGRQQRDFVSVRDVARAFRLALECDSVGQQTFNIGSSTGTSLLAAARELGAALGKKHVEPRITNDYRIGDIRHCVPDISRARTVLGYEPRVRLADGLREWAEWLEGRTVPGVSSEADEELALRGLTV